MSRSVSIRPTLASLEGERKSVSGLRVEFDLACRSRYRVKSLITGLS